MSNSRLSSSSSCSKRSAFLPSEVLKEFGCYGKKPRLDIKLTPLSSHSPSKSPVVANHKDPEDELWGEDLPDDVVEECVLLATQACEENISVRNEVPTQPKKSIAVHTANTPSSRNMSNGKCIPSVSPNLPRTGPSNCHSTIVFQQKKQFEASKFSNTPSKTSLPSKKNGNIDTFLESDKRLENENKNLKEKVLQKEGEVAILRAQLQKLELQMKTQSLEHKKSLDMQAQKYTKQITEQKKELEVTNTQLQLQIMEATSIRNHCKVLESGSKIKFVEPESPKAGSSKCRKDEDEKRSSKKSNVASPSVQKTKQNTDRFGRQIVKYSCPEQVSLVKEGTVLGLLVNEFLTEKSQPDNSWILYLRKKQDCSRKIKKAKDINKKILVLQKNNVTIENCYDAINKLITLDAVSSIAACVHVASVVWECQKIVCRQMHILALISSVQSYTEQGDLNSIVSSLIGKPATSNCKLMTSEKWFEEEEGIESRRALGLLCALCRISSLASELTYSSQNLTSIICMSEKVERNKSTAGSSKEPYVEVNERPNTSSESQKNHELPYNDYLTKPFGFLQLLHDVIFSICNQKRTKHFTGFLTASLKLLSAIGRNTKLLDGGLPLVSEIIREVVFCRPQVEAVVALFELLSVLAKYSVAMKSLCINSKEKTFVDNRAIGLAYFTRETCVIQVLFRLLPVSTTTVHLRTELCYHMVHWVFTMVCFLTKEECWLLSIKENRKANCHCRSSIVSGLISTLYNSLCDMSSTNLDDEIKRQLLEIFKKSIILLRAWREDKSTSMFNRDNFEYRLLLARIDSEADKLLLNDLERKFVQELYGKLENEDDTSCGAENEVSELYELLRIYQRSLPNHSLYFTSRS